MADHVRDALQYALVKAQQEEYDLRGEAFQAEQNARSLRLAHVEAVTKLSTLQYALQKHDHEKKEN